MKATLLVGVAATIPFIIVSRIVQGEEGLALALVLVLSTFILLSFFVYLHFHRKMKELKAREQWHQERPQQVSVDLKFREKKSVISNVWFILPIIISIGTVFLTLTNYQSIPSQIPMKYNFSGEVTNWADKSYRSVLALPVVQLFITLLFLFINTLIAKAKQQIDSANPERSIQQSLVFRRRWSLFTLLTAIAMVLLFLFIQLSFIFPLNLQLLTIVPLLLTGVVVLGAIFLSFTTGQGGSRVKVVSGKEKQVINRDDDKYWKLGQFYFNPNDPAMFLEKRFGVGWTINMANPLTWVIFVGIVGGAVVLPLWLMN